MHKIREILPGAWLIQLKRFEDARGAFVKTYAKSVLEDMFAGMGQNGLPEFQEEFYSISNQNVVRGMHFQLPPHAHAKIVYCATGAIKDVLLDLRKGEGYGRHAAVTLDANVPQLLFIPEGMAHGFMSLVDGSLMLYKTSTEHAASHDAGIHYASFGYDWQCAAPILSERDQRHPTLAEFNSPF